MFFLESGSPVLPATGAGDETGPILLHELQAVDQR